MLFILSLKDNPTLVLMYASWHKTCSIFTLIALAFGTVLLITLIGNFDLYKTWFIKIFDLKDLKHKYKVKLFFHELCWLGLAIQY